jgi:hypothetical protein
MYTGTYAIPSSPRAARWCAVVLDVTVVAAVYPVYLPLVMR